MDIQKIQQYKSAFDLVAKTVKDDDDSNIEVWYARELQEVLGYARWENFVGAVGRAIESCKTLEINVDDHFREVTKMVQLGSDVTGTSSLVTYRCFPKRDTLRPELTWSHYRRLISVENEAARLWLNKNADKTKPLHRFGAVVFEYFEIELL
jgi:hypothetical protein